LRERVSAPTNRRPSFPEARAVVRKEGINAMNIKLLTTTAAFALTLGTAAMAVTDPMVGGAAMFPTKNIVENAVNSKDHTTLVAAVKAAGLVDTLEGAGPFTVFAPTNAAFAALPAGTVDNLLKPENKGTLTQVLTYHVVPGRYDRMAIDTAIKAAPGGKLMLKTVEGETLTLADANGGLWVTDQKGNTARVTIADVYQSNGVIMVVDKVLMP
jgi:uncharacterized surface protein with fasciclin (FAS1) repeats